MTKTRRTELRRRERWGGGAATGEALSDAAKMIKLATAMCNV
jgi:hypothetical protein